MRTFFVTSLLAGFLVFSLTGCLMRTYPKTVERVDVQIKNQGNEGYILGTAPEGRSAIEKNTREVQVLEIELGNPLQILKEEPRTIPEQQSKITPSIEAAQPQTQTIIAEAQATESAQPSYDTYIVQNGDTLQKIAARPEIYGNYKKWRKIFDANNDKLSAPDKIFAGQTLRIPRD